MLKDSDAFIKFVLITGVSKFSKVSLFSGLNNLEDITLNGKYSSVCGYTQNELETVFSDLLTDVNLDELKLWYNGYSFLGDSVYNPFDILLYLKNREYKNYWFETGNPSFLIELIQENRYNTIDIENIRISEEELNAFDVENIQLEALLFQTGYLTIREKYRVGAKICYGLQYPNQEVKMSLTGVILGSWSESRSISRNESELYDILMKNELNRMKNLLSGYEAYYASVFYCYFTALGLDTRPEDVTNNGQADMTVLFEGRVYVFEFKVIELTEAGSALAQIKERKYYEKYITPDTKEIYLVGVEFSKENRNITGFEWEKTGEVQKRFGL